MSSSDARKVNDDYLKSLLDRLQQEEDDFKARTSGDAAGTPDTPADDDDGPEAQNGDGENPSDEDSNGEPDEEGLTSIKLRQEQIRLDNLQQNTRLRKILAYAAVGMVGLQLATSNLFFAYFLAHNVDDPDPRVMIAWLSSSVVEVIGILLVVARSLFKGRKKPAKGTA